MATEPPLDITRWLIALGTLTATRISVAEARAKLEAYAPLLADEFPPQAFTRASLAAVARNSKFFPTFGELCDHLSQHWRATRAPLQRLSAPNEPTRGPGRPPTDEERAYVRQRIAEIEMNLRSPQAQEPPRPKARYLTAEQLDQLNPLPEGHKRAPPRQEPNEEG